MLKIKRTKQEMDRMIKFNTNNTYKCSCGHSVVIYPTQTKRLCTWCNHFVFRKENDKFINDLTDLLKKENQKYE